MSFVICSQHVNVRFAKAPAYVVNPQQRFKFALDYLRHHWMLGHRGGFTFDEICEGSGLSGGTQLPQLAQLAQQLRSCGRVASRSEGVFIYRPKVVVADKAGLVEHLHNRYVTRWPACRPPLIILRV